MGEATQEHEWAEWRFTRITLTCCNKCGIVQRRDGLNKPCPGVVRVATRTPTPTREGGEG